MYLTTVQTKNNKVYSGYIEQFKPELGFIKLFNYEERILLNNIKSAITHGERVGYLKDENKKIIGVDIQDVDELKRAKTLLKEAREYGRFGMNKDTPLQNWEEE